MRVFLIGYPGPVGGACTEAWHTLRLWKEGGMDVHAIPTWGACADWEMQLARIGVATDHVPSNQLTTFAPLKDSIAVGICNEHFLRSVARLRETGCRLVWVGCMTWLFDAERSIYQQHGPFDAYVYQSAFQRELLEQELSKYGYDASRGHLIRGAFFVDEWEFRPRERAPKSEAFVVGRIARCDAQKWPSDLWQIYERINYRPLRARVMGWHSHIEAKCGSAPEWAETVSVGFEEVQPFLHGLHAYVTVNGGARENWPRVGLEAMAAGVPIVTEKRWGWLEMIDHGVSGFLGDTNEEIAQYATELAYDEKRRLEVAATARQHVEKISDPQVIWEGWQRIFAELES
jgi:glycosyltransferase involved in cell wall biosynthesis